MAEPVGFLGTAVGVVSLGLQVYGSLKKYLDDYNSRDVKVTKAFSRLEQLRTSLEVIKSVVPSFENEHRTPAEAVTSSLQATLDGLQSLWDKLAENESSNPTDLKGKMKETKNKLAFPFRKPDLDNLESDLGQIVGSLSIAIAGLNLNISSTTNTQLGNLARMTTANGADLCAIQATQATDTTRLVDIRSTLTSVSQSIEGSTSRVLDQVSGIETSSQYSHLEILGRLDAVQSFNQSQAGKQEQQLSQLQNLVQALVQRYPSSDNVVLDRMLTGTMISKPALLREVSDAASLGSTAPSGFATADLQDSARQGSTITANRSSSQFLPSCGCRRRRRTTRQSSRWRLFSTFEETVTESRHDPWCPFSLPSASTYQRRTGILLTGLHKYLSIAVSMSLCMTRGAGGSSISPTFRYFAMVDKDKSPAFIVVKALNETFRSMKLTKTRNQVLRKSRFTRYIIGMHVVDRSSLEVSTFQKKILHIGISKLRKIFTSGMALPTDVDEYGRTALQEVISWDTLGSLAEMRNATALKDIYDFLRALLELGIPCDTPTRRVNTNTISWCLSRHSRSNIIIPVANRDFISENILTNLLLHEISGDIGVIRIDLVNFRDSIAKLDPLAEALGLDSPIFKALLRRNEADLRRILESPPVDLLTQNTNGLTLAHLAIGWPAGLKILLDKIPALDIDTKYHGESPLMLATRYGASLCSKRRSLSMCSNCTCADEVEILLEAGCHLPSPKVNKIFRRLRYSSASLRCCFALLKHIKKWRDKLKELSLDNFPEMGFQQSERFSSSVLDAEAGEIITKLERKGVFPFTEFGLQLDDYRLGGPNNGTGSFSIYHHVISQFGKVEVAEVAFELGFRDLDVCYNGYTPLMKACEDGHDHKFSEWLIAHGADYTRLMPFKSPSRFITTPKYTVSHELMWTTYYEYPNCQWLRPYCGIKSHELHLRLLSGDGCNCGCSRSPDGCYPITVLLNSAFQPYSAASAKYENIIRLCKEILNPIAKNDRFEIRTEAILRAFTFNYLRPTSINSYGLRHTCCWELFRYSSTDELECYGEDHEEIREEDHALLAKLDELVVEFMEQFSSKALPLSEFMELHWFPRMREVRYELENRVLTEEEKKSIQSIGVKLEEDSFTKH